MFTWEDAYYDDNQYLDNRSSDATTSSSNEGPYSHDPLGLAVAKMSYQVYSLGEGYATYTLLLIYICLFFYTNFMIMCLLILARSTIDILNLYK